MEKKTLRLIEWLATKELLVSNKIEIHSVSIYNRIYKLYHRGTCPDYVKKFLHSEIAFAINNGYYILDYKLSSTEVAKKLHLAYFIVNKARKWLFSEGYINNKTLNLKLKSRHSEHNVYISDRIIRSLLIKFKENGKVDSRFVKKIMKMSLFIEKKREQNYIFDCFYKYNQMQDRKFLKGREFSEYRRIRKEVSKYSKFEDLGKSYKTIAMQLNICITTAVKYVKQMIECKIIRKFHNRKIVRMFSSAQEANYFIKSSIGIIEKKLFMFYDKVKEIFQVYYFNANIYVLNI